METPLYRREMEFQSTLPYRERPTNWTRPKRIGSFNPRSRTGSDRREVPGRDTNTSFNPRSRTGSDCQIHINHARCSRFQSTLPYRERRSSTRGYVLAPGVSIHAPVQGATACLLSPCWARDLRRESANRHFGSEKTYFKMASRARSPCAARGANLLGKSCELEVRTTYFQYNSKVSFSKHFRSFTHPLVLLNNESHYWFKGKAWVRLIIMKKRGGVAG